MLSGTERILFITLKLPLALVVMHQTSQEHESALLCILLYAYVVRLSCVIVWHFIDCFMD